MSRFVVFAPNWLGDAVMALPAIADLRRALPDASLTIAARPAIGAGAGDPTVEAPEWPPGRPGPRRPSFRGRRFPRGSAMRARTSSGSGVETVCRASRPSIRA